MPKALVVPPESAPKPLELLGEQVTVLASEARTGSYEIFRQIGPEGCGPPPHFHPWDEAFYVLEGTMSFGVDDLQDVVATPGTLVHVPGGSMHWFSLGPGGTTMISMTSSGGASSFFTQVDREVSPTNPDLGALIGIARPHDHGASGLANESRTI